jgi:8-oxo-dGTP diphosphatase
MRKSFNVRVYGVLIQGGKLLVSDEFIKGKEITKLPGGGLEFGEGLADCVVREFKEELDLTVEVKSHFYTTDFFVTSAFHVDSQVISIYYVVNALEDLKITASTKKFDFKKKAEGAQSFRWIDVNKVSENDFTFVIDRRVGGMIYEQKKMFL